MPAGSSTVSYKIEKTLAVLSTSEKGWTKELNLIAWGDNPPKLDIRAWSPDHSKMSKGITLSAEEAEVLVNTLKGE